MPVDDEIQPTVLEIISDLLSVPAPDLVAEPVLAHHQWDSMLSLEALAQLENAFGVELDLRTFHAARTVDDLVRLTAGAVSGVTVKAPE